MTAHIINIDSYQAESKARKGIDFASKGNYIQALELFEESLKHEVCPKVLTYKAWMMFQLGRIDRAIQYCHESLELSPDLPRACNDLGSYYLENGQLEEAEKYLVKALASQEYESKHFTHINLAKLWIKRQNKEQAIIHLESALELSPGNWEITKILAELRYQEKIS